MTTFACLKLNRFQYNINSIVSGLYAFGLRHAVISPGSRNAPLVMAFVRHGGITCHSVTDERSAGFIAMGMAKSLRSPVAVVCTSGSALANIYPAVLEAFYMQIPLLVISADRPADLIDKWDGQTIHQVNFFNQHVRASFNIPENLDDDLSDDVFSMVSDLWIASNAHLKGPVHLNVPLREPLYGAVKDEFEYPEFDISFSLKPVKPDYPYNFKDVLNESKKILVLLGASESKETSILEKLTKNKNIVVLTDIISNNREYCTVKNWESLLLSLSDEMSADMMPDTLITSGKMILNKQIKQKLRKYKPMHHWHFDVSGYCADTFMTNPEVIRTSLSDFLNGIEIHEVDSNYSADWNKVSRMRKEAELNMDSEEFDEMMAIKFIIEQIQGNCVLHLSNSMTVRNVAFLAEYLNTDVEVHCNRGVSGIDGCTSTATGMAMVDDRRHILITGDVAFLYDFNAFLTQSHPRNLKIVVMNNDGGGIFNNIDGPSEMKELNPFLLTPHSKSCELLAEHIGHNYFSARNSTQLKEGLETFIKSESNSILEVFTDTAINSKKFKQYKGIII